ncbi:unnamed protein product [Dibothriocephalus latus]|uniref:Galactosyltransferase N-terminal domain-containing protein n=1 Tax=Dibothriocephalus latus TaxID=60516 RepID=A0A3P7L9S4_DIBLA|nr:unnamed protein product [Dibothriocephalus latus]
MTNVSAVNDNRSLSLNQSLENIELRDINIRVLKETHQQTWNITKEKVAIIVPYRNRGKHLFTFLSRMLPFLSKQDGQYVIIITEQAGNEPFNRAKLFNVAVKEIRQSLFGDRLYGINCFIFHDVDKVPSLPSTTYKCGGNVRQLVTAFRQETGIRWLYNTFLGGVTAFTWDHVAKINGASNIYFGWGGEDDDLYIRLKLNNITVDRPAEREGIFDEFDPNHPREYNPERFALCSPKNVTARWRNDGIQQTRYRLLNRIDYDLFVWLFVSV